MAFNTTDVYKLTDFKGFISRNLANSNLAEEIKITGGTIRPLLISSGGFVRGVEYADGSVNYWACLWPSEFVYFS